MVRMAASVLGRGAVSFPCAWDNCLLIRSSPVLRPMVHWRVSSSPQVCRQLQKK